MTELKGFVKLKFEFIESHFTKEIVCQQALDKPKALFLREKYDEQA